MIIVTDRAKAKLTQLRATVEIDEPDIGLRLDPQPVVGEFALFPDEEKPGDQIVEHGGRTVLLIGEEVGETLADAIIDCELAGKDSRLVIKRLEPESPE